MKLFTFPTEETLKKYEAATPKYMRPNAVPFAVIFEGALTAEQCLEIKTVADEVEGFNHEKCGAFTRELGHIPELDYIQSIGYSINHAYWQYDLDPETVTWMQTYSDGGDYQLHMDAGPGRMRKMTAVTFLTDPDEYEGGDLEVFFHPTALKIPRTQGTIVCFQPWILHVVHPVTSGIRQSLNMSFWGPNFK
jgi:hypothetical protein